MRTAAEPGEPGSEREHDGVDAVDGDPERLGHLPVELRGPHDEAEFGAREDEPRRRDQRQRGGDDDELVARISEPREQHAEIDRRGDRPRIRTVERQGQLLDDVEQADGGDDGGFGLIVETAEHQPLGDDRDRADQQRRGDERGQKADRRMDPERHR